jgi:hypothetical protein
MAENAGGAFVELGTVGEGHDDRALIGKREVENGHVVLETVASRGDATAPG